MIEDLIAVFAGNYREYQNYLRETGLTQREAIWVTGTSIMGRHFSEIVKVGTYQDDPDYIRHWNYVKACLYPRDPETATTPPLPFTIGVR